MDSQADFTPSLPDRIPSLFENTLSQEIDRENEFEINLLANWSSPAEVNPLNRFLD